MILELTNGMTWRVPKNYIGECNFELNEFLKVIPENLPTLKISEHAEKNRVLPQGTPRPGPLDLSYTPYLIEPMDTMSPSSHIQRTVILKGAQLGFTMLAESVLCYYIGYSPSDILFMSSTAYSLERWSSRRLEPAIDSYGFRKFIYAQETNTKSKKTGDKTYSKEYFGCRLDMASYNSPASMASTDKRILLRDEVDRAPVKLSKGEGSPMALSAARVNAWGDRSKILDFSTPTTFDESFIWKEYQKGDQRKYFMPCPYCGKMIQFEMEYEPEKKGYGFKAYYVDNEVSEVVYVCECGSEIKEHQKASMMNPLGGAKWIATAKSSDKFLTSYYCPSVLAPTAMLSWVKIYKKYLEALEDPDLGMRTFTNIYMGLPFQETGARPKIDKINHLRGNYKEGVVPDGVLFLTGAVDVQRGKEIYQQMNDEDLESEIQKAEKVGRKEKFPRLEMEILGTGEGYRTYSITYKVFNGSVHNIHSGAWKKMSDYFKGLAEKSDKIKNGWKVPTFKRSDGYNFDIPYVFIDAHDGEMTSTVYAYTQMYSNFFPSMGFQTLSKLKTSGDLESSHDINRFRRRKAGEDLIVYQISTNHYKKRIYNSYKIERSAIGENPPRMMDHPNDYDDEYFEQLFGAEQRKDGSFHDGGRAVEALDCKVYSMCAADVYMNDLMEYFRAEYQKKGYSVEKCKKEIDSVYVLKWLKEITKRKL